MEDTTNVIHTGAQIQPKKRRYGLPQAQVVEEAAPRPKVLRLPNRKLRMLFLELLKRQRNPPLPHQIKS